MTGDELKAWFSSDEGEPMPDWTENEWADMAATWKKRGPGVVLNAYWEWRKAERIQELAK